MNSLIVSLLIILIVLLMVLIAIAIFLVYKFVLKNQQPTQSSLSLKTTNSPPENMSDNVPARSEKPKFHISEKSHCPNHKENTPVGTCLICEEAFCEECLIEHESLYFCKEHFRTYADNKWEKITDILTTADTPEASMHVYDFKRDLWQFEKVPTFVLTHYKINVAEDIIESYVQLHVREIEVQELTNRLKTFKKK